MDPANLTTRERKGSRGDSPRGADDKATNTGPPTPSPSKAPEVVMGMIPTILLRHVAAFADGSSLSGVSKDTLKAIRELHYRIDIQAHALSFSREKDPTGALSTGHMGLQLSRGALATGRIITRITVTGCTDLKDTKGGYQALEKAVQRVVNHSVPTLCSITIKGRRREDSGRVAAILRAVVPLSAKDRRVVPRLTHVELWHGADGVAKAGKAIAAGLWPALEKLFVPHCHVTFCHIQHVVMGIMSGRAPNLRMLNWDSQSNVQEGVDDVVLAALAAGKSPRIEYLSFTNNIYCSAEQSLSFLRRALQACSELRHLRMDFTQTPVAQLRDLTAALQAGDVPCLRTLSVRQPIPYNRSVFVPTDEVNALRQAASSRVPGVLLDIVK